MKPVVVLRMVDLEREKAETSTSFRGRVSWPPARPYERVCEREEREREEREREERERGERGERERGHIL